MLYRRLGNFRLGVRILIITMVVLLRLVRMIVMVSGLRLRRGGFLPLPMKVIGRLIMSSSVGDDSMLYWHRLSLAGMGDVARYLLRSNGGTVVRLCWMHLLTWLNWWFRRLMGR